MMLLVSTVISSMVNLGGSKDGSSSYVGMGAQIKQGVKIGQILL